MQQDFFLFSIPSLPLHPHEKNPSSLPLLYFAFWLYGIGKAGKTEFEREKLGLQKNQNLALKR